MALAALQSTPSCFNEFGSLGVELDNMLQATSNMTVLEQWTVSTTSQWNYNGLNSNPFLATGLPTVNTINHLAMPSIMDPSLAYFDMTLPSKFVLPPLPPTGSLQSRSNLPSLPPVDSANYDALNDLPVLTTLDFEEPSGPALGHARHKPVLSLHTQRDNMIGDINKKNSLPVEKRVKKSKGKHTTVSEANDGPASQQIESKTTI
ncbi:hypothetical protein V8B97DRAFT_2012431 [Scleroderma yunnanense]